MKKEPHIIEFTAKRGNGLHIHVSTTRNRRKISVDGGRLYYRDYASKNECLRAARVIRDEILREIDTRPKTPVLPLCEVFNKSYEYMPVALTTKTHHAALFNDFFAEYHNKPITAITLADIQLSVNQYAATHTQVCIRAYMAMWRRLYRTALYLQIPVIDYPSMVAIPKSKIATTQQDTTLSYETFMRALDALNASPHPLAPVAVGVAWVMYYTGIRITECLGLYTTDIDIQAGVIHVRRNSGATATKTGQIVPLKTDSSARDIPIAPALLPVLETAMNNTPSNVLFSDPSGNVLDTKVLRDYIHGVMRSRDIPFTLYRLRHLFSTDLFRAGVNPKVIQTLLGHASGNMSLYYAFSTEAERQSAILNRKPS